MGVLEDAIREHLELKRKHGASDDELLREESDALGPARRDPAPEEAGPVPAEADPVPAEPAREQPSEPAEAAEVEPEEPPEPQSELAVTAEPPAETPPEPAVVDFDQPEHEEQDRLPLEQKPPRDFDFD